MGASKGGLIMRRKGHRAFHPCCSRAMSVQTATKALKEESKWEGTWKGMMFSSIAFHKESWKQMEWRYEQVVLQLRTEGGSRNWKRSNNTGRGRQRNREAHVLCAWISQIVCLFAG
eukprot:GILI01060609.1.p1 GENE.GILI01060609.1~~GILI01060609.1.p1  ORF type:complete len:116 (-),score=5.55 GILI01060609.1:35-382(-)